MLLLIICSCDDCRSSYSSKLSIEHNYDSLSTIWKADSYGLRSKKIAKVLMESRNVKEFDESDKIAFFGVPNLSAKGNESEGQFYWVCLIQVDAEELANGPALLVKCSTGDRVFDLTLVNNSRGHQFVDSVAVSIICGFRNSTTNLRFRNSR
jgi:hypothetical protein